MYLRLDYGGLGIIWLIRDSSVIYQMIKTCYISNERLFFPLLGIVNTFMISLISPKI